MLISEDVVELTRALVAMDTINPPGHEADCSSFLAQLLEDAGFYVQIQEFAKGRTNLVAKVGQPDLGLPICFTGHMDTVPLGLTPWTKDPFKGEIEDGRLYGRGTADMKGGIAAFCVAAIRTAKMVRETQGVTLIITGGEETGCDGAIALRDQSDLLSDAGALVVGEPTSNKPLLGHKGALWLRGCCTGVTAHGSTPELGDNAIYKMARAIRALEQFDFAAEKHNQLSPPTMNLGCAHGGLNTNSVPDYADFELDIRTLPAQAHKEILENLQALLKNDVRLEYMIDLRGIFTSDKVPWANSVKNDLEFVLGAEQAFAAANYFTDASVLTPALNDPPTIILGPGDAALAHVTDEYCGVSALLDAGRIYDRLIKTWCAK